MVLEDEDTCHIAMNPVRENSLVLNLSAILIARRAVKPCLFFVQIYTFYFFSILMKCLRVYKLQSIIQYRTKFRNFFLLFVNLNKV